MSQTAPYNTHTYVYEIVLYISTHLGQHTHLHALTLHSHTSWMAPHKPNTHTYVYEIVLYIPTHLGWLCKHAQTHMYIIYKIMLVCCRVLSETCGNTHVYEIIHVRIYIPTHLGWLCKHAWTHMYSGSKKCPNVLLFSKE